MKIPLLSRVCYAAGRQRWREAYLFGSMLPAVLLLELVLESRNVSVRARVCVDEVGRARVLPWLRYTGEKDVQRDKPRSAEAIHLLRQLLELLTLLPAHALIYETGNASNRYQRSGGYQDTAPSWTLSSLLWTTGQAGPFRTQIRGWGRTDRKHRDQATEPSEQTLWKPRLGVGVVVAGARWATEVLRAVRGLCVRVLREEGALFHFPRPISI